MMSDAEKYATAAIGLVVFALIFNSFFGAIGIIGTVTDTGATGTIDGEGQLSIPYAASVENVTETRATLGNSLTLDGSGDASAVVDANTSVSGNYSVSTWARLDNQSATVLVADYEDLSVVYNGSTGEYVAYYWSEQSRSLHRAGGAATDPGNWTLLSVQRDGDQLELWEGSTLIASKTVSGDGSATMPPLDNVDGQIEETRVHDYPLSSAQLSEWQSERALAVSGDAPAVRVTYDSRDGDSTPVFFAAGSLDRGSGTSFADGFSAPNLTRGDDFTWGGTRGATVSIPSGSVLEPDGAVLFATYETNKFGGFLARLEGAVSGAIGLLTLALLVIAAGALMDMYDF